MQSRSGQIEVRRPTPRSVDADADGSVRAAEDPKRTKASLAAPTQQRSSRVRQWSAARAGAGVPDGSP